MVKEKAHLFTEPDERSKAELTSRAMVAWFASGGAEIPKRGEFKMVAGLGYVVLWGDVEPLAVYRVRSDNLMLRRMIRPPAALIKNERNQRQPPQT